MTPIYSATPGSDSSSFSQAYVSTSGILTITDPSPSSPRGSSGGAWEMLLRTLRFTPGPVSPSHNNDRTVEYEVLELGKWFKIGETYHFYDFISSPGIIWTAAKAAASSQKWYGKTGYLGTITSSEEFTHMSNQAPGNSGWLAGPIRQARPPIRCQKAIGNGMRGLNRVSCFGLEMIIVQVVIQTKLETPLDHYSNWPSTQPDNAGEEDALQITTAGTFNDLPVGYTGVAGYFVEWGGMPEPAATVTIKIQNHNAIKHAAGF